jgi:hypothetical protein
LSVLSRVVSVRKYGKIESQMFRSNDWRQLTDDGRMLVVYLLACGHSNLLGCYYLPMGYAAEDLDWPMPRTQGAFTDCESRGFLTYRADIRWVFVHKFLKFNDFENGNVAKAGMKTLDAVPAVLRHGVAQAMLAFASHLSDRMRETLQAVEPCKAEERAQEGAPPVAKAKPAPAASAAAEADRPAEKKAGSKQPADTAEAWAVFEAAYSDRYPGSQVLRNAATNSAMANFVKQVGREIAPRLARFYLQHNDPHFVRSGHDVKLMLGNAQRLMTEMATGVTPAATVRGAAPAFVREMHERAAEATGRFAAHVTSTPTRPTTRVIHPEGVTDVEPVGERISGGY